MVELNKEMLINRKAVQRHMREMGLSAICPVPNLSKRRADHAIFPQSLWNLMAARPNHIWGVIRHYLHPTSHGLAVVFGRGAGLVFRATSSVGNSISHWKCRLSWTP